jgi:hypothetical protein
MTGDNQAFRFTPNDGENSIEWYDNQGGFNGISFSSRALPVGAYSYILSYQDFEYQIYDRANCSNCFGTITITR